jgi:ribosomal protein L36
MLLPRLSQSSTLTRSLVRSLPGRNLLQNAITSTFCRSITCLALRRNPQPRSSVTSLFDLARSARLPGILHRMRPQQTRGMKTRSSVKRLCDGRSELILMADPDLVLDSRFEGKIECSSYGRCSGHYRGFLEAHLTCSSSKNPKHKQRQGK